MCLIIRYVPTSTRASNCVPCFKQYVKGPNVKGPNPRTPCQHTIIPSSGILQPQSWEKLDQDILIYKRIFGGSIHALQRTQPLPSWSDRAISEAYAFGVVAYGSRRDNDLACSLLYIPDFDISKTRKKRRMEQIQKWLKFKEGPTDAQVKTLFPTFKRVKP